MIWLLITVLVLQVVEMIVLVALGTACVRFFDLRRLRQETKSEVLPPYVDYVNLPKPSSDLTIINRE